MGDKYDPITSKSYLLYMISIIYHLYNNSILRKESLFNIGGEVVSLIDIIESGNFNSIEDIDSRINDIYSRVDNEIIHSAKYVEQHSKYLSDIDGNTNTSLYTDTFSKSKVRNGRIDRIFRKDIFC